MDKQKFKKGDSIEETVELLETIHRSMEEKLEERGLGKKTRKIDGIEIVTKKAPEIPLELPPGYFSNVTLDQLEKLRKESEEQRLSFNAKLEKKIEQRDAMSSTVDVEESIPRISSLQEQIAYWSMKLKYINFLIEKLDRAILELKVIPDGSLDLKAKLSDAAKLSDFSPEYFSDLDLKDLKVLRDSWNSELGHKLGKKNDLEKMSRERKYDKRGKEDLEKLKDRLQAMGLVLDILKKFINDKEREEKSLIDLLTKPKKVQQRVEVSKDPILEDIKKKMGIPPIKREPLPKMPRIKEVKRKPLTQTIFDENQLSEIQRLFEESKSKRGLEIEASFGYYDDRGGFISGTGSGIYFSNLLNRIKAVISSEKKGGTSVEYTNTRVDSRKIFGQPKGQFDRASNVRRIVDLDTEAVVWQYKTRSSTIDNRIWGIRISKSTEKYLSKEGMSRDRGLSTLGDLGIDPETWEPTTTRFRRRTSFIGRSESSLFYGVKVELTTVRQINHGKNNRGFTTFEIEVERVSETLSARRFTEILKQLYKWMFGDYSHSIFINAPVQRSVEPPSKNKVKWDKKNKVFSDGSFAYKTEDGEKAYGKIVKKRIRVLTSEERDKLTDSEIAFKNISKEDKMLAIQKFARGQKLSKLKNWDENLKIFTDGIYAYFSDKDKKLKVYAIIVGPEKLSENDKEQLKRLKKKFSDMTQAEVNETTVKIRESVEKRKDEEETVEIYRTPGTRYGLVFKEKEIIWDPNHIMTLEERRTATELHNKLFWYDMRKKRIAPERETKCIEGELADKGNIRKLRPYQLWSDYWNKPTNIKLKNFLDPRSKWALTLKYDGVRSFLFIHEYGTYMVSPPYTLIYMGEGDKNMSGTLLDGEFMSDLDKTTNSYTRITFWAFDLLFYRDEDYRNRKLVDRLSALNNSVKSLKENPEKYPYLKMKKYIMKDSPIFEQTDPKQIMGEYDPVKELNIYENIKKLLQENKNLLGKINNLLKDVRVPQEMIEITIKRIEDIVKESETDEDEHLDKITEVLESIDLNKKQRRTISTEVKKFLKEDEEIVEKTDGLILQSYSWYCNKYTFKWKPPVQLTIDFYLQRMTPRDLADRNIREESGQYYYFTMVGGDRSRDKNVDMSIFEGDYDNPYIGYIALDSNTIEEDGEPIDGRIVECEWDKDEPEPDFYPVRIREDKIRPNNYYPAAISVWQDINDPITRDSIEGINLKIMRKYHNEVKFDLLKRSFEPGATILDIGSGRGGDILKWRSLGFKNVYALEPNSDTREIFQTRLEKDMERYQKKTNPSPYPRVEILNYGAEKYRDINDKLNKDKVVLDGIVSFFSLTFFPKNKQTYKKLLKTISLIPPGGKFIGIVLSGEKVKNLLDTSNSAMIKDYKEGFMVKGYTEDDVEMSVRGGTWNKSINAWTFDDYSEKKEVKNYIKDHKTYKCDAFSIQQQHAFFDQRGEEKDNDEICNAFIGDEIEIDLRGKGDDQSTMVKSQTEWLFDFDYFKKKMREMNFSLVESHTLDYPVTGPNDSVFSYQNLPKDSQTFSSLNKVFIFKKKSKTEKEESKADEVVSFLDPGEVESIKLKMGGVEYDDIERVGIVQSHASFIHCILQALDSKYRKIDTTERETRVNKLRETLVKDLTLEEFLKLQVSVKELGNASKRKKDDKERALEVFKETLKDIPRHRSSGSWVGELEMTELLSKKYKVNIYVVDGTTSLDGTTYVKPSTLFADQCETLYNYDKSVVLFRLPRLLMKEGYHESSHWYDLLKPKGKKNMAVFSKDSEFVQQLHQEICG